MMVSHSFEYDLGQKVLIKEINRPGFINALLLNSSGTQYRVIYWDNCSRKDEWLYSCEIKNVESENN